MADKYSVSDKLAIALTCLAGAMAIVLFLVEKTPLSILLMLAAMFALLIYPTIHFFLKPSIRILVLGVCLVGIAGFGYRVWPHSKQLETAEKVALGANTTQAPQTQQIPPIETTPKPSKRKPAPSSAKPEEKTKPDETPPLINLKAGSHMRFEGGHYSTDKGSILEVGKGVNDLSFKNPVMERHSDSYGPRTSEPRQDERSPRPRLPYREHSPQEVGELRASTIDLITNLNADYIEWRKEEHAWLEVKHDVAMADKRCEQFTKKFESTYQNAVIEKRDDLLTAVKQIPKRPYGIESYYRSYASDELVFPQDVMFQLCDLISLLNAMESENGLPLSEGDIKPTLMGCR